MSRTIRRKNCKPDYLYDQNNYTFNSLHPWNLNPKIVTVTFNGVEHKIQKAFYHSDRYYYSIPKWFKKGLNKKLKLKNKKLLKAGIRNKDIENIIFYPFKSVAAWQWW